MSEQVPEERVVLSVGYDIEGVAQYLDALGIVPETLRELGAAIDRTEIGSTAAFAQKGAQLAQALAAGYQASIRGALGGGITPADFAIQNIGGDTFRRQLEGQADAAMQYARALQVLNEAAARARTLGNPAFQPLTAGGGPGILAAGPNVQARQQADTARTRQAEDRFEATLNRLANAIGGRSEISFSPEGVLQGRVVREAVPLNLPSTREENALRRQAEQEAIATNRAILDSLNARRSADVVGRGTAPELFAEAIEARLGSRNASTFFRGRDVPAGVARRLDTEQRVELFGEETFDRGAKIRGPGFVTPQEVFQGLLEQRARDANPQGFRTPPELQTAQAAETEMVTAMVRERQQLRVQAHRAELAELTERLSNLQEISAGQRRYRGVRPRGALPTGEAFEQAFGALQGLSAAPRRALPQEMVTVFRGSNEPLDLGRIGGQGLRVTTQRDYAEQYGGDKYLYSAQIPKSRLGPVSDFTGEQLPHTFLSREEAEALQMIRQPQPPPVPRRSPQEVAESAMARLTAAGVPPEQAQQMAGAAARLAPQVEETTTRVRQLAAAIDQLGDEATETAGQVRQPFRAGAAGIEGPGALVPTGVTQAERNLRNMAAFEGVFPRGDIAAGQALRAQLLAGGGPRALTAGTSVGGLPVLQAGSVLPGFPQGPFLPPGGLPPGGFGGAGRGGAGAGAPGFGTAGFNFDDIDEAAQERARNRRRARETFAGTQPDFEGQFEEERLRREQQAARERDRADRQFQADQRQRAQANAEDARFNARQGGFFQQARTAFTTDPTGAGRTPGERFRTGLFSTRGGDLLEGVGQTARFSVLYGLAYSALFQVSQAISAVTKEAIAYEDALVNLEQATGRSRGGISGLAEGLSESAARAGLAPSVGVEVGARAIGLFGVAGAPTNIQDQTAETVTRVATQVARVTGADPKQVVTDMAGTLRSLGLGAQSAPELQDQLTFIRRQTGAEIGELLPALANIGTLGAGAGFSAEELMATIGQVVTTTGQTPNAAAGSFRQVLSRADDPNFQARVGQQFGFDATGMNLRDIFAKVAETQPDTEEINKFSLLFGRGASQQVAQILTRDFGRVEGLAGGAGAAAGTGIGAQDFAKVRATVGGVIQGLGTDLLELGQDLIDTGIVDSLLPLVKTLDLVVNAVDEVVDAFNVIPRPLRSIALALGELYLAARLFSGGRILQAILGTAGAGGLRGAAAGGAAPLITGLTRGADGVFRVAGGGVGRTLATPVGELVGQGLGAAGAEIAAARAAGVRATAAAAGRGVTSAASALGSLLPIGRAVFPVAAVAGSALIASQLVASAQNADRVRGQLGAAETAFGGATTANELKEAAASAREARDQAEKRVAFGLGNKLFDTEGTAQAAENLRVEARRQAEEIEREQRRAVRASPEAAFGDFSNVDAVAAGLKTLSDNGYTAAQRLDALNNAFDSLNSKTATGTDTVATVFAGQGRQFGAAIGRASTRALVGDQGVTSQLRLQADASAPRGLMATLGSAAITPIDFVQNTIGGFNPFDESGREKQFKFDDAAEALDKINLKKLAQGSSEAAINALKSRGKDPALGVIQLDQGDVGAIDKAVLESARDTLGPALKGLDKDTRQGIIRSYAGSLAGQVRATLGDFSGGNVDPASVQAYLQNAQQTAAQAGQEKAIATGDTLLGAGATLGGLRAARQNVLEGMNNTKLTKGQRDTNYRLIAQFDLAIQQAEDEAMSQRTQRAQAFADLEKSNLSLDDTIGRRAVDLRTLRGSLRRTRDPNEQKRIQAQINETEQQQALDVQATGGAQALADIDPRRNIARTRQQLENARGRLALLDPSSSTAAQARDEIAGLEQQVRQQRVDRLNSQVSAGVAGQDSGLAQARASVEQARNTLGVQLKGTQGYYDALANLRQTQRQLGQAELEAASIAQQLEGDITDPVEAARDEVADAVRKLNADRASGQGKDVIGADRLAVQRARVGEEDAAFQQQFGDMQFADQMGDISHQSYISYLRNTLSHLTEQQEGMKKTDDGYRATTEKIQQIRSALKSTVDGMDAIWNLGDIKVPTPFEVRRSLATEGTQAGATGDGGFLTSLIAAINGGAAGVSISINGADVGKVRAIIGEYLGPQATGRGKKRKGS